LTFFAGKWITRFSKANKLENFQRDGEAPTLIPMMEQENYPVKMGIDPDLGCTVSVPVVLCMYKCQWLEGSKKGRI